MTCHQECCSGCPSLATRPFGSTARALSNQRPNRLLRLFGGSIDSATATTPAWWLLSCQCSLVRLFLNLTSRTPEYDHDAPQVHEAQKVVCPTLVAADQTSEIAGPSEEPHYLPAPLVTPQLAPVLGLQLPSRLPGAADLLDVLTVVACRRKEGTARIWRASTLG